MFILIAVIATTSVSTADIHVNGTNGDDGNLGTTDSPFQIISKSVTTANTNADPSNDIIIDGGNYSGTNNRATINKSVSIYSTKYKGYSTEDTIIDGQNSFIFQITNGTSVSFYGITFFNTTYVNGAVYSTNSGSLTFENCSFINCTNPLNLLMFM